MREKKMGMRRLAACVLVAALALGGCGDDARHAYGSGGVSAGRDVSNKVEG